MAKGSNSLSKTAIWILMGLLIVGLAGFGATSFTGNVTSVGRVGDAEIDAGDYARALENELRSRQAETGQALTVAQAQQQGITQAVLSRLVVSAALEHEADEIGLSVGDAQVARDLATIPAFQGPGGDFDREAYAFALRNAGLTEREFEEDLRDESAATLLQAAIVAGQTLPDTYSDTLIAHVAERRDATWARLDAGTVGLGTPVPDDGDLRAFYDENIDRYTAPRTKRISYAWLTPDMILDSVEVDEAALREAYEEQRNRFNLPERRLVERLVYLDEAAAQDALRRLEAGEATFEALVEERDLALADTDMGDVTRDDLGAAADTVFAAEPGAVVAGPSPLGPALFRINGVLQARETAFEDAVPALRDALALDRARRVVQTQAQGYDDELAAGATLEELARTTELRAGTLDWTGTQDAGIAGYPAFQEAAAAVGPDDFPEIEMLGDGGVFALRLDEVIEPAPIPFAEVRDRVETDWTEDAQTERLVGEAEALAVLLRGGEAFADVGLQPQSVTGVTRGGFAPDLPAALNAALFALPEPGAVRVVPGDGAALIVRLDAVAPPDMDDPRVAMVLQQVRDEAAGSIANDLFRALAEDIQSRAGVEIDQAAINAVHTSLP